MRIAVMGASGRVGHRIVQEALARGHAVVGLDITRREDMDARVQFAACDLEDSGGIARAIVGCDAYVFCVIPILKGVDKVEKVVMDSINACLEAGVPRFLYVAGGMTSWIREGVYYCDENRRQGGKRQTHKANDAILGCHKTALEMLRGITTIDWVCQTAPAWMEENMGGRTGRYRTGGEYLVLREPENTALSLQQNNHISMEDFAVAMLDEIEQQNYHRQRYTVGY